MPASRPECMSTSVTRKALRSTWRTADIWSHGIARADSSAVTLPWWPNQTMRAHGSRSSSSPGTTASSRASTRRRCARPRGGARRRARGRARGLSRAARRGQARRPRAARSRIDSTFAAWALTSCGSAAARAAGFGRGSVAAALEGIHERVLVQRVDERPPRGDELGRATDAGGDDRAGRCHRLERREPERLDEARLAEDVAGGEPGRDRLVRDPPDEADPLSARERLAQRAVANERQCALSPARMPWRGGGRSCAPRGRPGRGTTSRREQSPLLPGRRSRRAARTARDRRRGRRPRPCRRPRAPHARARLGAQSDTATIAAARRTT